MAHGARARKLSAMELATTTSVRPIWEVAGGLGLDEEQVEPHAIRELRAYTGAGWVVALCGDMQTMPGLPSRPAAFAVDIEGDAIRGLR